MVTMDKTVRPSSTVMQV